MTKRTKEEEQEDINQHSLLNYKIEELAIIAKENKEFLRISFERCQASIDELNRKLFVSNGTPCYAERIRILETIAAKAAGKKVVSRANMIALWMCILGALLLPLIKLGYIGIVVWIKSL